jgi:hypothetical protein
MIDYRLLTNPSLFEWSSVTPFSGWQWPVGSVLAYVVVIVSLRILMRNREPFDMRYVTFLHNAILFVLSVTMCIGQASAAWRDSKASFRSVF